MLTRPRPAHAAPRFGGGAALRRALVALLVVTGSASAAGAAPLPKLTSTVVVTATGSAYTEVTLAQPLAIPAATRPDLRVSGARVTALALVRVQRGETPPGLFVTVVPGTSRLHFAWLGHARGTHADDDPPTFFTRKLPAGKYRLYVFTEGRTTVTWRLPLRRGRTALSPRSRTSFARVASQPPGVRGTSVSPAFAETLTATVANRGLMVGLTWYAADARAAASLGNCTYPGPPSAPGLGPAPVCLDRDVSTGPGGLAFDDSYVSQGTGLIESGRWTSKHYVRVAGAVRDGGVSVFMADLGAGFPAY